MNEEREELVQINFLNQIYKIILNHSKQSTTNYNDFIQEIFKNILENINQNEFLKKIGFLIYSMIRQIEFLIFTNSGHETKIFKAIENNDIESVKFLIENCFYSIYDENEEGKSVFSYSLERDDKSIYNYLLSKQQKK